MQKAAASEAGQEIKVREGMCVAPGGVERFSGGRAENGEGAEVRAACGQAQTRTVILSSPRRIPTMDPPPTNQSSEAQPAAQSPLTSYRWHTGGGGEKGAGGFHWGRLAGWGRALSHQEPIVNSQPARRSLFRRVLSAPPKESRPSRLRISKSFWGKHKSPPLEPEPTPEASGMWLPHPELGPDAWVLTASRASDLQTQEVVGSAKAQQEVAGTQLPSSLFPPYPGPGGGRCDQGPVGQGVH